MTKSQEQMQKINQSINEIFMSSPTIRKTFQDIMPRSPSYHYYTREGSKDRYFYTTEKTNHKGKPRYVAGIYRYLKSKKALKLVKRVGFAKRKRAKEWALKTRDKVQESK